MNYYQEVSGILAEGQTLNQAISGDTIERDGIGTGYGAVYGIYKDGEFLSYAAAPHTREINTPPGYSGVVYYPNAFTGSSVGLHFKILKLSGDGFYYSDTGASPLLEINDAGYNGPSGYMKPSGYLLHREAYKLLPNYANISADFATGTEEGGESHSIVRGGIYPSMLYDNIITINLEIRWSGASGDAENC
jgi:hypothetical protein